MQYKTHGFILKRTNLGEADRILTILTDSHGKIRAVAKGVRKTLSKLAGHLELFCLTELVVSEGKSIDTITGAQVCQCFFNLRNDLKATNIAHYLAEIVDSLTAQAEPHPEMFHLFKESLTRLDNGKSSLVKAYFEINFLSYAGFRPELFMCLVCRQKIISGDNSFNFQEGGLICSRCSRQKPLSQSMLISDNAVKVIRLFLKHGIGIIDKVTVPESLLREIEKVSNFYIESHHQKGFKSKRFLK